MALNQLENSADILDAALDLLGQNTDGTSEVEYQVLRILNEAHREVMNVIGEDWLTIRKRPPGTFTLQPKIDVVAYLTNNSQLVTFDAAPTPSIDAHVKYWFFKVRGRDEVYRIATHDAAGTSASLDSRYVGDSANTADAFLFKLEYDLPASFDRFVGPLLVQHENRHEIDVIHIEALDRDWPLDFVSSGIPRAAGIVDDTTLRFSHYSDSRLYRVEFPYEEEVSTLTDSSSSYPQLHRKHYPILVYMIAGRLGRILNDDRAEKYENEGMALLALARRDNQKQQWAASRKFGLIQPRQDFIRRRRFPRISRYTDGWD